MSEVDKSFAEYRADVNAMGPHTEYIWKRDPKHLAFNLAKYKFVAKMLEGKEYVLDVGCGDCFGTKIVLQTVNSVTPVDSDIRYGDETIMPFDMARESPFPRIGVYDAAYSLDCIEHIEPEDENRFFANIVSAIKDYGVCIIGTPNVTGAIYAGPMAREEHTNLYSYDELRNLMQRYFRNVFMFGMNDEVVHTGFGPMCHYLLAMGVGKR